MIRSMTGYGEAELETPAGRLRAGIKTVNHRFFSINIRLPTWLERFEPKIRERVRQDVSRGHANVSVRLSANGEDQGTTALKLDVARAREYLSIFQAMKDELGLAGEVDVALLSRFDDIIVHDEAEAPELDEAQVRDVVGRATAALVAMREEEGRRLRRDLDARLASLASGLDAVAERAPDRLVAERDRLRASVAELVEDIEVDDERLAREIAILADKWDISEEIVRLRSHMEHFRGLLDADAADPVGKRLAFLVQEMHRETNTIGSKANDAAIEQGVVAMKNEVERLREQVENVE